MSALSDVSSEFIKEHKTYAFDTNSSRAYYLERDVYHCYERISHFYFRQIGTSYKLATANKFLAGKNVELFT